MPSTHTPTRQARLPRWARMPLLGLRMRITRSTDKSLEGVEGIIINETKKTFTILTPEGKKKKVLKRVVWFRVSPHDEEIAGWRVEQRMEDRLKLK